MSILSTTRLLLASCLVTGAVLAAPAFAQDAPAAGAAAGGAQAMAPVVAIVDVDAVMQECAASKGVRAQLAKYQQSYQDEVSREEQALRTTKQDLDQQRQKLSQDAFAEKARAFEQSIAEYERKVVARRRALDKSFSTSMATIEKTMLQVTADLASTKGANVVLPRAQVILFNEKMNITAEVVDAMNKKLPSVEFPTPHPEAEMGNGQPAGKKK